MKVLSTPVMGVLVSRRVIKKFYRQVAHPRLEMLALANKTVKNTLYFFSVGDVNLHERTITGCYWNEQENCWQHRLFQFPDALYIRGTTGKDQAFFAEFIRLIRENNGQLLNYPRFNKWDLYQGLQGNPVIKEYLPATISYRRPQDIIDMLKIHGSVYLKAHNGRKGDFVMRLESIPDAGYRCSYYRSGRRRQSKLVVRTYSDLPTLLSMIRSFFQGKEVLVQQAIELLELKNNRIDMRAELQRNGEGSLEIVGVSVRVGNPGSPITTHGSAYAFEEFSAAVSLPARQPQLQSVVRNFLYDVYYGVEAVFGKYCEIGIDFALDKKGHIWLIECNSQSTKVSLGKAYGQDVLLRAYANPLLYARYLYNKETPTKDSSQ